MAPLGKGKKASHRKWISQEKRNLGWKKTRNHFLRKRYNHIKVTKKTKKRMGGWKKDIDEGSQKEEKLRRGLRRLDRR